MSRGLPAADLSGAFGKSPRSAGLPPPRTAQRPTPTPVADPTDDASDDPSTHSTEDQAGPATQATSDPAEPAASTPAKKTPAKKATAAKPPQSTAPAAGTVASGRAPRTRKRATAPKANTRPSAGKARLVLWTPVAIRERMQALQAGEGTLYLDQVLDALEATVDQLPELVAQAAARAEPVVQGALFERATAPQATKVARVQLTIRGLLESQLQVIDQLVETTGAPSRSALVNAALDATLPA